MLDDDDAPPEVFKELVERRVMAQGGVAERVVQQQPQAALQPVHLGATAKWQSKRDGLTGSVVAEGCKASHGEVRCRAAGAGCGARHEAPVGGWGGAGAWGRRRLLCSLCGCMRGVPSGDGLVGQGALGCVANPAHRTMITSSVPCAYATMVRQTVCRLLLTAAERWTKPASAFHAPPRF